MKRCTKCNIEKDETEFYKNKECIGGLSTHCKKCQSENNLQKYYKRKEKLQIQKEKILQRKLNKPILTDEQKRKNKLYRIINADRLKFLAYIHRAKKRNREFTITFDEFKEFIHQPCHYCGHNETTNGVDRKDNIKGYIKDNCLPCCFACNKAKLDTPYDEFLSWVQKVCKYLSNTKSL